MLGTAGGSLRAGVAAPRAGVVGGGVLNVLAIEMVLEFGQRWPGTFGGRTLEFQPDDVDCIARDNAPLPQATDGTQCPEPLRAQSPAHSDSERRSMVNALPDDAVEQIESLRQTGKHPVRSIDVRACHPPFVT